MGGHMTKKVFWSHSTFNLFIGYHRRYGLLLAVSAS
jgi:hypothetical protein